MTDTLTIQQADALGNNDIQVTLSDGRVLVLTLSQILGANPQILLPDAEEE